MILDEILSDVPACKPGPKAQGFLPKSLFIYQNSLVRNLRNRTTSHMGAFQLIYITHVVFLNLIITSFDYCRRTGIIKNCCLLFNLTFVAFLVSVHGVASLGGENLKSPEENHKCSIE